MSDRAILNLRVRSAGLVFIMFRLINAEGTTFWQKFHWTPKQGLSALVWDEAQKTCR